MTYQCVQHNKRIEISVDMEFRQLGKINGLGVSTVGAYQQLGCIDSSGKSTLQAYRHSGVSTVWAYQQLVIVCLQNVNKQKKKKKMNNVFLLPRSKPFI
jgi:hypothetical protein